MWILWARPPNKVARIGAHSRLFTTYIAIQRTRRLNRRPTRVGNRRLPNGLAVRYVSKRDVAFLYQEIYQQRCYLRHGISLPRGGTVLDIGGNIGLFALSAAEELGPEVRPGPGVPPWEVPSCQPSPAAALL